MPRVRPMIVWGILVPNVWMFDVTLLKGFRMFLLTYQPDMLACALAEP